MRGATDLPLDAEMVEDDGEDESIWGRVPLLRDLRTGKKLTKGEAEMSVDIFAKAIKKYGELLDEGIPLLSRTQAECQIWGTIADEEAQEIAEAFVDLGRKYVLVAQTVRGVVRSYSYLRVGAITFPRFKKTVTYYLRNGFVLNFSFGTRQKKGR